MKKLTIIVPIYNIRKDWVTKAVDSVLNVIKDTDQIQLIVIDNGSTDKTI
jgi:glycosyltransferase involved in cell wall biosynthesis